MIRVSYEFKGKRYYRIMPFNDDLLPVLDEIMSLKVPAIVSEEVATNQPRETDWIEEISDTVTLFEKQRSVADELGSVSEADRVEARAFMDWVTGVVKKGIVVHGERRTVTGWSFSNHGANVGFDLEGEPGAMRKPPARFLETDRRGKERIKKDVIDAVRRLYP